MDSYLFNGFADELVKIAEKSSDSSFDKLYKNIMTAGGAIGGAIPLSLLGVLAGGRGRRLRGAGIGALTGGTLGAAINRSEAKKNLDFLKKESASLSENVPLTAAAGSGATYGGLGALLGLLAARKGKRLKRSLFAGGTGAAIGGLGSLGVTSGVMNKLHDMGFSIKDQKKFYERFAKERG